MQLNPSGAQGAGRPRGLQHHLRRFPGQSVDQVNADVKPGLAQQRKAGAEFCEAVAPVEGGGSPVVDGLQPQLNFHRKAPGLLKLREHLRFFPVNAVSAGSDPNSGRFGQGGGLREQGGERRGGKMGVGTLLKIGDRAGVRPFGQQVGTALLILFGNSF